MSSIRFEHHPVSGIRQALIDAVREHDAAAADWMGTKTAGDLAGAEAAEAINLCGLFCWDDTPQGYNYWNALDDKVGNVIDRRSGLGGEK